MQFDKKVNSYLIIENIHQILFSSTCTAVQLLIYCNYKRYSKYPYCKGVQLVGRGPKISLIALNLQIQLITICIIVNTNCTYNLIKNVTQY